MAKRKGCKGCLGCGAIGAVIVVVIALIAFQVLVGNRASGLQAQIDAARKEGMPLEVSDILPSAPLDPTVNADSLYPEFDKLAKEQRFADAMKVVSDSKAAPEAQAKAIRELRPLLDLADRIVRRPYMVPQKDWSNPAAVLFPEFATSKSITRLLCLKAETQSRAGDGVAAMKSLAWAHTTSKHAGQSPTVIGMLVAIANEAIVLASFERVLSEHSADPKVLAQAKLTLDSFGSVPSILTAMGGEVIFSRSPFVDGVSMEDIVGSPATNDPTMTALGAGLRLRPVRSAFDARAIEEFRRLYREMPSDPQDVEGFRKALSGMESRVTSDQSPTAIMLQITTPVFGQLADSVGQVIAGRRLAATAVRLCEARRAGRMPTVLQVGTPDEVDPFNGDPLRLSVTSSGFKIWSVGRNRIDDGAVRERLQDIVFEVKR